MEFKAIKMASKTKSLVHPACNNRGIPKRKQSSRKYSNTDGIKGEEHWSKVLKTKEKSSFYKHRCSCRRSSVSRKYADLQRSKSGNSITGVFRRFCLWINKRLQSPNEDEEHISNIPNITRSGSDSGCETDIPFNNHPILIRTQNILSDSLSINDSDDPNYVYIRNSKSGDTSPSQHRLSSTNSFSNLNEVFYDDKSGCKIATLSIGESGSRQNLTVTRSAPSRSQRTSRVTHSDDIKIKPYNTWPLKRRILVQKEEEKRTNFDDIESNYLHRNPSAEDVANLKEFSIPYEDLEFSTCFRSGRERVIYKGRWHGDVNIHYYGNYTALDFWHLVTKMQRVRHENVALFMGTCTAFNRYAIIESIQDGVSLYDHIHIQKEVSSMQSKIQLLRQISHGMGYLHAKGITVKTLNTRNIFLCPKARVSVMDYGITEPQHDRHGFASIPRGSLTYLAPEILRTVIIDPPLFYATAESTKESDVFAFGTIVYELVKWRYPFFGQSPESVIWKICNNVHLDTDKFKCAKAMQRLLDQCWSFEPIDRPSFANISRDLNRTIALHKRHSVSEPDILNKTGSVASYC